MYVCGGCGGSEGARVRACGCGCVGGVCTYVRACVTERVGEKESARVGLIVVASQRRCRQQ
jgi:hypothetical protein